jgi:hypothetical protein
MSIYRQNTADRILSKVPTRGIRLQDYQEITPALAKVVVSVVGKYSRDELSQAIAGLFDNQASVVANSFRSVGDTKDMVGFVTAHRETVDYEEATRDRKFRAVASNMLMDETDQTMWELKEGASGKYMVRNGIEDLSELATRAVMRRPGSVTMAALAFRSAAPREIAAFVDPKDCTIDYGFIIGSNDSKRTIQVLSYTSREVQEIASDLAVDIQQLEPHEVTASGMPELSASADRQTMVDYYKKAYGFNPDYVQMLIDMIDQHSVA